MNTRHKLIIVRKRRATRVRAKIEGTATSPRLSVFRSNRSFYAQLIDDENGRTLASVSVKEAASKGEKGSKSTVAEMIGGMLAEKAKKAGITKAIFDRGRYPFNGRVKAFAEGARKGGLIF
jgi:large subunit ribosomal protein L18